MLTRFILQMIFAVCLGLLLGHYNLPTLPAICISVIGNLTFCLITAAVIPCD